MIEHYYVLVDGSHGCQYRHKTLASAYTEARRIFDLDGQKRRVFVLQTIGVLEPVKQGVVVEDNGGQAKRSDGNALAEIAIRRP